MTSEVKKPTVLVEHEGGYSLLLQTAFDQVCDKNDWKGPIDALVPWSGASVYVDAIMHMTGSFTKSEYVFKDGRQFAHITSVGYRMGPAGDH